MAAEENSNRQGERRSYVDHAVEWLRDVGKAVPESVLRENRGSYDALITHGIKVEHAEKGRILCSLIVPTRLCNAGGKLHGGAITSIVDIVGSAAIVSTGSIYSGVSVEINVTFMSGIAMGEELEIEAKTLRIGKSLAVVSVDLHNKSTGQNVAQGRHTKFVAMPNVTISSRL